MVRFIDRGDEIGLLEEEWKKKKAGFIVVYGRRRIGKTRLLMEFAADKKGIYFIGEDTSRQIHIRDLKNAFADFFNDSFLRNTEIRDWSNFFEYLKKIIPEKERFYIILDEFSYFIKVDDSITSSLQKFWDLFLSRTNAFFVVSGSIFGLMEESILSSSSPLYGRRTRDILLGQLPARHAAMFLETSFEEKLKTIMCIGGIPEYLIKASESDNFRSFVENEFFKKSGYFYREPYYLLSQEFKEIKTYFSIITAIALGNTKATEIANFVGIDSREIYPYLENLIRHGFIKKEISVVGDRKGGIYLIEDNFFDFWFNFVYLNRNSIEKKSYSANEHDLNRYLGKRFEMLIRTDIFQEIFGPKFEKIGRWWHKDKEIDIVALNENAKEILFGECKWQNKVNSEKIAKELAEKTRFVDWNLNKRKESYAVFAKSFSKRVSEFEGKRVYCFDLRDLEKSVSG